MRSSFLLVATLTLVQINCSNRPIISGQAAGQPQSWEFIQSVGGIALGEPYVRNGVDWVPIRVDVSGNSYITRAPSISNTGLVCVVAFGPSTGNLLDAMEIYLTVYTADEAQSPTGAYANGLCHDYPLYRPPGYSNPELLLLFRRFTFYYVDKPPRTFLPFMKKRYQTHHIGTVELGLL